jgi:hypothetical protein
MKWYTNKNIRTGNEAKEIRQKLERNSIANKRYTIAMIEKVSRKG